MASTTNLFSLVNQLQNLEHSLTGLLMEMAVKMGNLTDANVFLLVETQEGRTICGQRHLCQQYLKRSLTPVGTDQFFDVDASLSSLQQVATFDQGIEIRKNDETLGGTHHQNPQNTTNEKRGKRQRCDSGPEQHPPIKVTRLPESPTEPDVLFIKNEPFTDGQDDDVVPIPNEAGQEEESLMGESEFVSSSRSLNLHIVNHSVIERRDANGALDANNDELLEIVNSKLAAQKIEALKYISGENAFSRGTVENRLSTSLCKGKIE